MRKNSIIGLMPSAHPLCPMPTRIFSSLSFQISAAFLILIGLFATANLSALDAFQRQIAYDRVVEIAGRLELTAQQLHTQAMNYQQNAPRDYTTYYRDVRLYYQDLSAHVETFDQVVSSFMSGELHEDMTGARDKLQPGVSTGVTEAILAMETAWSDYRAGLFEALGPDMDEPRLEYAANHNLANYKPLELASHVLTESLRSWAADEHRKVQRISLLTVIASVALALGILVMLHYKAMSPLKRTIAEFHRVADGDFSRRLDVVGSAELRALTESFNQLSGRLHVLFQLIGRLQQGNDMDEVICFLSREFPHLLRIDWIGVVMLSGDRTTGCLEVSYLDREPERVSKQLFSLRGSLVEQALEKGAPMHIRDMEETAARNPRYQFLHTLVVRGMRDAIFLPLTPQTQTPIPAVVVFATRRPGSYDEAHLRFLGNIAQLITHSFGRTVRLTEHARLAAIGEFASGIAHELRTPLTTIGLAMDYFDRLDLPGSAEKRLTLARQEAERMRRLLEEILLYAKPVTLKFERLAMGDFLDSFVADNRHLAETRSQEIQVIEHRPRADIMGDPDRLTQVLSNLTQNACEAAPDQSTITWTLTDDPATGGVILEIHNPGPPIPQELQKRITEPFFSTKPSGTGLGLAIVQRLTRAQGGELSVHSSEGDGTRIRLTFPRLDPTLAEN